MKARLASLLILLSACGLAAAEWVADVHYHSAAHVTSGVLETARLGSGTANGTTFLRGDQTWATPSSSGVPSGAIVLMLGACTTGYTELASLSGKTIVGTVAANGDVTNTGGSDTITPAGTVSQPSFTGTQSTTVLNHTHTVSVTDPGHAHTQSVNSAATGGASGYTADTSTNSTATSGYSTLSATTGITASTANPAGGAASYTPAGTVSQPTFSGTQFDNRAAFVKVIFCQKD